MAKAKAKMLISPCGEAIYPHLNTPNTQFSPVGTYEVSLRVTTADKDLIRNAVKAVYEEQAPALASEEGFDLNTAVKSAAKPWRQALDDKKNPIPDMWDIKFSQKAGFGVGTEFKPWHPGLYDMQGEEIPADCIIGYGSRVHVAYKVYTWYVKSEIGFSLKLCDVQVRELKQYKKTAASIGFAIEAKKETTEPVQEGTVTSDMQNDPF